MDEVPENLTPKEQEYQSADAKHPSEINQVFFSPLQKRAIFCCTLKKKWQDQRMPTDLTPQKWLGDPHQKVPSIEEGRGGDIKWNGPSF